MILSEIKQYLGTRHAATLNDLAIHFDTAPEALRDMLQIMSTPKDVDECGQNKKGLQIFICNP